MSDSNRPLHQSTALITGASRGIGAAIARRLSHDGAHVILHYGEGRDETHALAQELRSAGGTADIVQADLSTANAAETLMAQVTAPRIDILVNNAGVAPFAPFADTDAATFDRLANINMRSLFFITQAALPRIPEGGRIINISTRVTQAAFVGIAAYAATKGFVDVLTLQLAAELGPRRIAVNAVHPGAIDTRMSAWIHGPRGPETLAQMQALPGIGQPEQVAAAVAFLAGPDATWTTGSIIDVSGGTKL
jgi:3-oxoacyl-[acyl-carrier protein] reductase